MLPEEQIYPELNDLLRSIRKQIRRFVVMDAFLAILGLFSAAFWLGYLIDYTPVRFGGTEMPHLARLLFLCVFLSLCPFWFLFHWLTFLNAISVRSLLLAASAGSVTPLPIDVLNTSAACLARTISHQAGFLAPEIQCPS